MPFRSMDAAEPPAPRVNEQMELACKLMYEWRYYTPVIAGGALWSWAAGVLCRDVDLFVKDSWLARRKANKSYGASANDVMLYLRYTEYFTHTNERPVHKYLSMLSDGVTPVDIVMSPWKGTDVVEHFDYEHCMVAFSPSKIETKGAKAYSDGKLIRKFDRDKVRDEHVVAAKYIDSLWGKQDAVEKLDRVMYMLNQLYKKVSKG